MKINKLEVTGLRGVKETLSLDFSGRSSLLYGDNGAGKSTIADVIEWFYNDKIEHLTGEEIGRSGVEALRHISLPDDQPASVSLTMSTSSFDATKTLVFKGSQLKAAHSNNSDEFQEYTAQSRNENLILRYRDLTKFILATKTERLEALSAIIGYKEITATRDVLKNAFNTVQRDIKARDFPRALSELQQEIIEQYAQNITSDEQFLEVTRSILNELELGEKLHSLNDINTALKKIGKPDNSAAIKREAFLTRLVDQLVPVRATLADIEEQYAEFSEKFSAIVSDVAVFRKLLLGNVLTATSQLLGNEAYDTNECPVCLTEKDKAQLKLSVDKRIEELSEIKAEQKKLSDSKDAVARRATQLANSLNSLLADDHANEEWFSELRVQILALIATAQKYESAVNIRPSAGVELTAPTTLKIDPKVAENIHNAAQGHRDKAREVLSSDPSWDIYNKINIAGRAYANIRKLNAEKAKFEAQKDTLEIFYKEFLERQRAALQLFLETFSNRIQGIYQFMNPGEKVGNIKLVPLEKNEEMVGITFQLDFLDHEGVSPPHKYLSESHLNCFGIAFFLASADAFNKRNKFLVLDDVISSFDEQHRKRFADLLAQKYNQYQLIVLTHERGWFQLVRNLVRGRGWLIDALKYTNERGTEIGIPPRQLKEAIEAKILEQDTESFASLSRKYLERMLKDIALNLEVRVPFRFNDVNEDRMCAELLSDLRAHLNRKKCDDLKNSDVFQRLEASTFIGNKDSHDSAFVPGFSDAKAFWDDVCEFEALFFCGSCETLVSTKFFDPVENKIRCKGGEFSYSWKK